MTPEEYDAAREYLSEHWADEPQMAEFLERALDEIDTLHGQIATLKAALIEERARALWFTGHGPYHAPNLDWTTPPNDIPKSVRWLWEVPAKKQLIREYPEVFQEEQA